VSIFLDFVLFLDFVKGSLSYVFVYLPVYVNLAVWGQAVADSPKHCWLRFVDVPQKS